MAALRNAWSELGRRKLRNVLTVIGIGIGVAALLLLGALSEKLSRLVLGGRQFAAGQITVSSGGSGGAAQMGRGGLLAGEQLQALERVPGVRAVAPIVMFPLEENPGSLPFTLAPLVFGVDMELLALNEAAPPPAVRIGRGIPAPEGGEVVIGSQVAQTYGAGLGSTLDVRGRELTVVGILETTFTGPDSFVFMPFPVASRLLIDSEPLLRRLVMVPGASVLPIATAAAVFWHPGENPERLAARIRETVPDVSVMTPSEAAFQIDRSLLFLNAVILGSGLTALLVASLAVASTMVTAVVERRREIGLRRVVGATRGQVVRQLVVEAGLLGLLGGLLGVAGGWAAVAALNDVTLRLGAPVFLVTVRLVVAALLLPVVLAAAAGTWPALRAARLAPTDALRWT